LDFRIRQLQCFLTLADLLNYNKTARVLYMSQPTISFQIKSLEESFGAKLFVRDRQQVRLTEAGRTFREYAQTIMDTVDSAHEAMSNINTRLQLRVACGPVGQFVLLPSILRMLTETYPDFELEVLELTTEQMIARLPEGKVDALLMVGSLPVPGLHFDPLYEDSLMAMVSCRSPLAQMDAISVECLRTTPIIASRMKDCRFHQPFVRALLAPFGITPRIVESPQSCTVQFAYAAAGEGLAIATRAMEACLFPNIVARPFQEELPVFQLGLASMASNDSAAMAIFRSVALKCASTALTAKPRPATRPVNAARPKLVQPAVAFFPGQTQAS
jgi:DNA-binding transcriptional LysR family regulator